MIEELNNDIVELYSDTDNLIDKMSDLNERVKHLIAASRYPECEYELNELGCRWSAGIDALVDLHEILSK